MSSGPFMSLVYRFLKVLVQLVLGIFYPNTTVIGKEHLRFEEAAIVISNHPNTLIDPLQAASRVRKQVFFLANAGLFSTPFTNWFFNTFYCIPIKRKQDKGAPGVNNEDSFARCDAFLGAGGVLYVAPEGGSQMERRVRDFKTGTVRIAISAAKKKNFDLDISILPIGVHYDRPNRFGSACVVNVGEAIKVQDWQGRYGEDPPKTVRAFTDYLEEQMRSLVVDVAEGEQQQIHPLVEDICRQDTPLDAVSDFRRSQLLANQLKEVANSDSQSYQDFKDKALQYANELRLRGLDDQAVTYAGGNTTKQWGVIALGFPFFVYGMLNHIFAAGIPALLARKMKIYIGYQATIKALVGLLTFPLFYILQSKLVEWYAGEAISWVYLLTLPLAGWIAWKYWGEWKSFRSIWIYARLENSAKKQLQQQRDDIRAYIRDYLL